MLTLDVIQRRASDHCHVSSEHAPSCEVKQMYHHCRTSQSFWGLTVNLLKRNTAEDNAELQQLAGHSPPQLLPAPPYRRADFTQASIHLVNAKVPLPTLSNAALSSNTSASPSCIFFITPELSPHSHSCFCSALSTASAKLYLSPL